MSPGVKETQFLKRGDALLAKKDYARALLEFHNAVSATPKDAEPYYRMGMAYLESKDLQSAVQAFQKAIALDPKHAKAQLKMAELMTATQDKRLVGKAVTQLEGVFGSSLDNPEVIDTLAIADWELGKPEKAFRRLEEGLQKFPTHLQSAVTLARLKLSSSDYSGAEEVLKKAVGSAPQSSQAALALGEFYIFTRQPAKAEPEVKRALHLDPKNGSALIDWADIQIAGKRMVEAEQTYKQLATLPEKAYKPLHAVFLYQFGKREKAVAEFEALAKAEPNDREARSRLVGAYLGIGRLSDAENVLTAALKRNPKDTDALLQRSELRLRASITDDAERDLREVLHFQPDSADAHYLLSLVYHAKALPNLEQQELLDSLKRNPRMLQARLSLAARYLSSNNAKAALDLLDEAPQTQKNETSWLVGRNWALLALGNLKEATAGIEKALQQGWSADAIFQRAVLNFSQRDYAGARTQLDELLKRGVQDIRVARLMLDTYKAEKNSAKGGARLKELAAAHPDSAPLQYVLGEWYEQDGNLVDARKAFGSAKAADAHFVPAELALAEADLKDGKNDASRQRLSAILKADPDNISALLLSAQAEKVAADHAAVIARYRAVLNVDHSNLIALNNLAYNLAPDDPDEALKFAQQAAEIAPDSPTVQDTLGWIYYRKGLYSMAVPYLKRAVDKETNPRRQFHLGMSYIKSGDQINGRPIIAEALRKDPALPKTEQGW